MQKFARSTTGPDTKAATFITVYSKPNANPRLRGLVQCFTPTWCSSCELSFQKKGNASARTVSIGMPRQFPKDNGKSNVQYTNCFFCAKAIIMEEIADMTNPNIRDLQLIVRLTFFKYGVQMLPTNSKQIIRVSSQEAPSSNAEAPNAVDTTCF